MHYSYIFTLKFIFTVCACVCRQKVWELLSNYEYTVHVIFHKTLRCNE